jgi:hypothetical protein
MGSSRKDARDFWWPFFHRLLFYLEEIFKVLEIGIVALELLMFMVQNCKYIFGAKLAQVGCTKCSTTIFMNEVTVHCEIVTTLQKL